MGPLTQVWWPSVKAVWLSALRQTRRPPVVFCVTVTVVAVVLVLQALAHYLMADDIAQGLETEDKLTVDSHYRRQRQCQDKQPKQQPDRGPPQAYWHLVTYFPLISPPAREGKMCFRLPETPV